MKTNKRKILKELIGETLDSALPHLKRSVLSKDLKNLILFAPNDFVWTQDLGNGSFTFIDLIISNKAMEFTFNAGWFNELDRANTVPYNMLEVTPTVARSEFKKTTAFVDVGRLIDHFGKRPPNQSRGSFWWKPEAPLEFQGNCLEPFEYRFGEFDWENQSVLDNINKIIENAASILWETAIPYLHEYEMKLRCDQ